MTTPLFPSPTASRASDTPDADADTGDGPRGRWVLHRAGLLNVWQYDRTDLAFAGGRLLLRGKNGAGKSKALEVLLPFLLDGDTRQLDATGRDRTTVTWLMTDGRPNGNHIGYVWLELRCVDDDGGVTFQTLGAGLRASTASRRTDSWFFITDRRIGIDFDLEVAGECLSAERLKAEVGDDAVTDSGVEHRRRVGRQVFGLFDEARYRNLLHLLHRLRDPNIGNRVEAGELATVLTDALPPIDERVLTEAAGHFDDLDVIKEQVKRSTETAAALGQFLGAYRGYTRTVLARRTAAVEHAEAARARAARAARQLSRAFQDAADSVETAEHELGERRGRRLEQEAERRELERSEGYRAHQDLVDRQERVAALSVAAETAESAAARAGAAHQRAVADLAAAAGDVRRSVAAVDEAATAAGGLAAEAGLDPALLGGRLLGGRTVGASDSSPAGASGAAAATDGSGLDPAELALADDRARAGRTLVDGLRRRATALRTLAQEADQAVRVATGAEERAAAAEAEFELGRTEAAGARAVHASAERAWADAVGAWTASGLAAGVDADWAPVHARFTGSDGESTWVAGVRQAVVDALAPPLQVARQAAAATEVAATRAEQDLGAADAELAEVEAQTEARPVPHRCRDAERDPAAGSPFYELVDVGPGVSADDAAGLEAALEAAGLLDAWVTADGLVVHPHTRDTLVRPDLETPLTGAATLGDVLVPASADGSPVAPARVAQILAAIGLGEQAGVAAWVTTGGRWRLGVLEGAWAKQTAEFLGATARRATRERLLTELRDLVDRSRAALGDARSAAAAAGAHRDSVEVLPATLPPADAIETAARERLHAERALAAARARFDAERRRAEDARATANRLAATVARQGVDDGLPTSVERLDDVLAAMTELRDVLADHRRALVEVARDHERFLRRRVEESERATEAAAASAEARQRTGDHAAAVHELATLRTALAATVDAVLARHAQVSAELDELDESLLPAAETAVRDAHTARATAEVRLGEARSVEDQARTALTTAAAALEAVVALPGVMLAATGRDARRPADVLDVAPDAHADADAGQRGVALAAAVAPEVVGDDEVSDGAILSRYDRLSDVLSGGYDAAIDEHEGVKVVHVADDSGRQPLAVVAARMSEEAEAARDRLAAREREVLERFLLRELADEVRAKLLDAHDLVTGTNRTLASVHTSHGKGAHLEWKLADEASAPAGVAARLLVDELRDEAADAQLRDVLMALIDAERVADPTGGYEQHLRAALDYRGWHRFVVKVTEKARPGTSRTLSNRLGLSQGEQRVLSYLALFAAAAAHFDAIARDTPTAPRLLLLDDAFAKVDEPTHSHLLGLLVDLDLDFVLTSERIWGCFASVPSLEIYEAVRDPALPGVALVHFRWDGQQRHLVGV